jgi:D-amino-acid oxidase
VNYNLISEDLYMFPRTDGILLGGTYDKNQWDPTPDMARRTRIVAAHREMFEGMRRIQAGG